MRARRRGLWPLQALLLWLALELLSAGVARAQSIPLRRYAHDQGLLGLADTCLLQTGDGSLWVCTESGLYRFNGHRFEQVPLQGQRGHFISAATEDAEHRLWVATFDALYVGDGTQLRRLTTQETGPLHKNKLRLASAPWGMVLLNGQQALRAVPASDGRWRLRPLFDAATLARLPQLGKLAAAQSEADTLWLGCDQELCRVAADGSVTVYGQAQGLPPDRWRHVVRDHDGALWLRGDHHVMQLPAAAERFVARPPPGAGQRQVVGQAQILLDPQGRVLVRTGQGLARWEHGHWRQFDRSNGLPDGGIVVLLFDRAGDLWMTVDGEGVVRWNGYGWIENWDVSQGMSTAPTWSILRNGDGALLLGNEAGINRQRRPDQRFQPWLADAGLQVISLQIAADGSLWSLGSLGELRHHDRHGRLLRSYPRLGGSIRRVFLDADGRIWILAADGLYLLQRPQSDDVPQRVQALPAGEYSDIQQRRDGTLWLAGAAGVFRLRGDTWTPIRLQLDGKPAQPWVSKLLIQEDGQVWAALYNPGVWQGRLDGDTLQLRPSAQPEQRELQIYLIRRTRNGWIWIGHNQGVDVYDGRRWSRLTQSQGLLWDDISESAFFEDHDSSVWIGTSKGVSHILAPPRLFQANAPGVMLSEFSRGGHPIAAGARLPWNEEPLHIEAGSPDLYDDRNRVSLRYRFEGAHTRWIYTPNFEIEHPPLAPGDYTFELQLLDAYRHSASAPVRVAFSVAPVWWRSQTMLALYALLGGGLAIAALHWREGRLRQRERHLADLVALRTQELEHDKRELEIARAALAVKASHDSLTGLLNRAGILDALAAQMRHSLAEGWPLAVAMIDLDHFKRINDTHGHLIGDAVLTKVAQRLNSNLRESDLIGRYGGEELLGVLPGLPIPSHERLQDLRVAVSGHPLRVGTQSLAVTASIGVAWYRPGESLQQLLARADEALYRAKRLGRNRVELQQD
ncbi:diguanylate cyclase (GGDEF)-like protein [Xanthomonas sp. JAI131]|uniref:ligand-binding sensor domain-containing diguanylate cyclase n=1 Tax=Xanthomonas sp. JAI131 TaxID=2723067 RepID=UPI0017BA22B3|nr:ligand-binding sensor domain-containing diguanylate cyclase [Xanthomonas sp. JAI131]NYF19270.1 diguanylate cyclase (GGDEF)-like protein [Xanthomonas sp. JAI131]